jgi:hypothetical protein
MVVSNVSENIKWILLFLYFYVFYEMNHYNKVTYLLDFLCVVSIFCVALWLCDWYMSSFCVLFHVHAMSDRLFFFFTCILILLLEYSVFIHVK